MGYWALTVKSPGVHKFPKYFFVLDEGINIFNVEAPSIEPLLDEFKELGVEVLKMASLEEDANVQSDGVRLSLRRHLLETGGDGKGSL